MTALIFDCDGVLVDSEPLSVAELGALLRGAGVPVEDADIFDRMIGRPLSEILGIYQGEHGIDVTSQLDAYRASLAARFRAELQPIRGIARALDLLDHMPRACASSSTLQRLELTLKLTGLWDRFAPHIYSATQVARGTQTSPSHRISVWSYHGLIATISPSGSGSGALSVGQDCSTQPSASMSAEWVSSAAWVIVSAPSRSGGGW